MDKRWRNLFILISLLIAVGLIYILFNSQMPFIFEEKKYQFSDLDNIWSSRGFDSLDPESINYITIINLNEIKSDLENTGFTGDCQRRIINVNKNFVDFLIYDRSASLKNSEVAELSNSLCNNLNKIVERNTFFEKSVNSFSLVDSDVQYISNNCSEENFVESAVNMFDYQLLNNDFEFIKSIENSLLGACN